MKAALFCLSLACLNITFFLLVHHPQTILEGFGLGLSSGLFLFFYQEYICAK